jgi:hypothetical protein
VIRPFCIVSDPSPAHRRFRAHRRASARSGTPSRVAPFPDFRERAAIFDHTVRGALSPPNTSRAPGFATQDHAQARDSNAAQGNTQDMEATSANQFRKECQGCSEARMPSRPRLTYSIFRSDCHLPAMDSADRRLRPVPFPASLARRPGRAADLDDERGGGEDLVYKDQLAARPSPHLPQRARAARASLPSPSLVTPVTNLLTMPPTPRTRRQVGPARGAEAATAKRRREGEGGEGGDSGGAASTPAPNRSSTRPLLPPHRSSPASPHWGGGARQVAPIPAWPGWDARLVAVEASGPGRRAGWSRSCPPTRIPSTASG